MGLGGGWFLDSLLNCVRDGRVVEGYFGGEDLGV